MILPDTEWTPDGAENSVLEGLQKFDLSFGLFEVADLATWGGVKIENTQLKLCEKPSQTLQGFAAWGLIGFRRAIGSVLFEKLLESTLDHQTKTLHLRATALRLEQFRDLTRS